MSAMSMTGVSNGNQERVLEAIRSGAEDLEAIVRATGLAVTQVRNAIKRLQDAGEIRRKDLGGYAPVVKRCRLEEVWK